MIIILGLVVFGAFYLIFFTDKINDGQNFIILVTILVIFFGNAGFGLIPSMLASRFPIHLRNIRSSLAYNGGLVIGFASPFISMEFFLFVKDDYLLSIPIVLGAISIIIGSLRLLKGQRLTVKLEEEKVVMEDKK